MMRKNKRYAAAVIGMISLSVFSGCGEEISDETTNQTVMETSGEIDTEYSPSLGEGENESLPAPSDELYEKIKKTAIACERYYSKKKADNDFFSWAGFLSYYDESGKLTDVTIDDIKNSGYLNSGNTVDNSLVLYLKPSDVDKDFKKTALDVFAAVKTADGYIIGGVGFDERLIPEDKFREMILKYNIDKGAVSNPETGGAVYNSLIVAIGIFRGDTSAETSHVPEYIVRYAANNDLYAVVILSGTDDVTNTTEYLLKKENDSWKVVEKALENQENVKTYLNSADTDFDMSLLPPYTLYIYRKEVRTTEHYENVINALREQKIIDASDEITYCCGTQHVLYIELASGKKLAGGAKKDGSFSCNFVNTYEEAIKELGRFVEPVPAFILKYNH